MKRKRLKICVICFSLLFLTGCWNYRELEDLAIVGAIGIDIDGDDFNVSIQVVNPKKSGGNSQSGGGGGSEETAAIVYNIKAKTIREALTKMVLDSPKRLYIGHMNLLVVGEEAAKKGIEDFFDFFMRDTESRKIFTTVVSKGSKAIDVLKIIEPLENISANNIHSSFEATNQYYGSISNATFDQVVMCLFAEGRNPTIAAVEIKGPVDKGNSNDNLKESDPKTRVEIVGAAVLKPDKLVGYLNEKESIFYSMIRSKVSTTTISFQCDDNKNYGNVVIDNLKTDLNIKVENNFPKAEINVTGRAALTELNCDINLKDPKEIDKLQAMVNKEIKKIMYDTVSKVQNYNSDIFGYGEQLNRNMNSYWKKHKKEWDTIFPQIKTKVKSKIEIERISSTIESVKSR